MLMLAGSSKQLSQKGHYFIVWITWFSLCRMLQVCHRQCCIDSASVPYASGGGTLPTEKGAQMQKRIFLYKRVLGEIVPQVQIMRNMSKNQSPISDAFSEKIWRWFLSACWVGVWCSNTHTFSHLLLVLPCSRRSLQDLGCDGISAQCLGQSEAYVRLTLDKIVALVSALT